ncbi:MAG: hypothetical protein C0P77_005840 [Thermoanaerobacterales bacterium]|nr:hypothetical protein [Thermoanaerobacterales bacterium]
MVVFLLLGVVWAAVLVPPWLQSRREARSVASISSFRSQLWSLQRATPHYDADTYTTYTGEDEGVDLLGDAEVDEISPLDAPYVPPVPPVRRHRPAYRRRRRVLGTLLLTTAGFAVPAVLVGWPWTVAVAVSGTLLATYVALLVRLARREIERAQKVRYLTPIRPPRPSVVVISDRAAQ